MPIMEITPLIGCRVQCSFCPQSLLMNTYQEENNLEKITFGKPDDYVIATGKSHSVLDFVKKSFEIVDLNWKKHVKTDKRLFRILEVDVLEGDSSKAQRKLHWKPKVDFDQLVNIMMNEDLKRWSRWQKGEYFPWDALNSIDEYQTVKGNKLKNKTN